MNFQLRLLITHTLISASVAWVLRCWLQEPTFYRTLILLLNVVSLCVNIWTLKLNCEAEALRSQMQDR